MGTHKINKNIAIKEIYFTKKYILMYVLKYIKATYMFNISNIQYITHPFLVKN